MRLSRLLNPLQWNLGPRTTATLLAWAAIPVVLTGSLVWRSMRTAAAEAGLTTAQLDLLSGRMLTTALWTTIPLFIVVIGASVLFSLLVVKPLWLLRQGMDRIAQGDLSHEAIPVKSEDEVGQISRTFNTMTAQLSQIVRTIVSTASALDGAAGQLEGRARESLQATESSSQEVEVVRATAQQQVEQASAGAKAIRELEEAVGQVSMAASAQAHEVESAAETVRQVAAAIDQVAQSAGVVAEAATRTRQAAEDGRSAVQLSAEGMNQVRSRVLDGAEKLRQLSESLSHVDEILQLITGIAGQTELLALNAAIEAARVGEHGKGFAVVAGEVRDLADRVRKAAGEIGGRINSLRIGADAVVESMEAGTEAVEQGVVVSRRAEEELDRILAAVAETQSEAESISAASEEIAAGSAQVVNATVQLSAIAEENAATAEQMLGSARAVTGMITQVEAEASKNQAATTSMAASTAQVRASVDEMVELAGEANHLAATLHQQAAGFQF